MQQHALSHVSILVSVKFRMQVEISNFILGSSESRLGRVASRYFSDSPVKPRQWPANMRSTNARCPPKRHAPRAHTRLGFVSEDPLPPSLALRLTPSLGSSSWSTADACTAFERPHGTTSRGQVRERQRSTRSRTVRAFAYFRARSREPSTLQPENGAPSISVDCCSILLMRVNALRISWGMSTTHARTMQLF